MVASEKKVPSPNPPNARSGSPIFIARSPRFLATGSTRLTAAAINIAPANASIPALADGFRNATPLPPPPSHASPKNAAANIATGSSAAAPNTDHATDHRPCPDAAAAHAAPSARGAPRMAAGSATCPPRTDVAAASAWPSAAAKTARATRSTPAAARTVPSAASPRSRNDPCDPASPLSESPARRSSSRCPFESSAAAELDSGPSAHPFRLSLRFLSSRPASRPLPELVLVNLSAARRNARYPRHAPPSAAIQGASPTRHLRTTAVSLIVAVIALAPAATAMSSATSSTADESTPRSSSPSPSPADPFLWPYLRRRPGVRTSGPNSFGRKNAARRHASGTARHASAAGKSASAFEPTTAWTGKVRGIGSTVASFDEPAGTDGTAFAPALKTPAPPPSKVASSPVVDGIGSNPARTSGTRAGAAGLNGESKLPSSFSRYDVYIRKPSSAAAATVAHVATSPPAAWSSASGSNSARVIHTMHPAANPMAKGSSA
mmetsp:Transcript_9723/g.42394  ORF Transcript_9723/g.42394 Transcript_9723/m.42394 type:complete len:493 (+) Transcript_9723:150-1628(+)